MGPGLRYAAGKLGIMDYERVGEGERKEQKEKGTERKIRRPVEQRGGERESERGGERVRGKRIIKIGDLPVIVR